MVTTDPLKSGKSNFKENQILRSYNDLNHRWLKSCRVLTFFEILRMGNPSKNVFFRLFGSFSSEWCLIFEILSNCGFYRHMEVRVLIRDRAHTWFPKRKILKNDAELLAVAPNFDSNLNDFASLETLIWARHLSILLKFILLGGGGAKRG